MIVDLKQNEFLITTLKFLIAGYVMEKSSTAKFCVLLISSLFFGRRKMFIYRMKYYRIFY